MSNIKKISNINSEKGAIFIPVLIWGGIAITGWFLAKSALGSAALDFLAGLLVWVSYLFVYIARFLCFTATDVFDTALTLITGKTITTNPTFLIGWAAVRDLSNMLIVLGFIIIGVATTLRIRDYEAKKLLVPFILIALLINFSGLFCGLIIDASNIVCKSLLQQSGGTAGGGLGAAYHSMMVKFSEETLKGIVPGTDEETNKTLLAASISVSFTFLIVAAVFFYMAIIFIARYGVLAFLFILSPLAFICKVFPVPAAQKIWNSWWENFIKWAFIGVGGCFSLWISSQMMQSYLSETKLSVENLVVILLFLIVGFKITTKSSAAGAGAVIGMATGAVMFGATKTASKLAGATGLTTAGQVAKEGALRAGEKMRLVAPGTAAASRKQRLEQKLEEPMKKLEKGFDDNPEGNQKLADVATRRAFTPAGMREKAAAGALLAKRKALGYLPESQREAVAANAVAYGATKETFTKESPNILTGVQDEDAKESLKLEYSAQRERSGASIEQARADAKTHEPSKDELETRKKEINSDIIRQRTLGYAPVLEHEIKQKLMTDKTEYLKSAAGGGHSEEEAKSLANGYNYSATETTAAIDSLKADKLRKAIRKLSPAKAAELPTEALDEQALLFFTDKQLGEIERKGGPALVDHLKKFSRQKDNSGKYLPVHQQSQEYQAFYDYLIGKHGKGSAEWSRAGKILDQIDKMN